MVQKKGHTTIAKGKKLTVTFFLTPDIICLYLDCSLRTVVSAVSQSYRVWHSVLRKMPSNWTASSVGKNKICFITLIFSLSTAMQCALFDLFDFDACKTVYFLHGWKILYRYVIYILVLGPTKSLSFDEIAE